MIRSSKAYKKSQAPLSVLKPFMEGLLSVKQRDIADAIPHSMNRTRESSLRESIIIFTLCTSLSLTLYTVERAELLDALHAFLVLSVTVDIFESLG